MTLDDACVPLLELPHSSDCLVCGRSNSQGLKLSLHVDPEHGTVQTRFTATANMSGFTGYRSRRNARYCFR